MRVSLRHFNSIKVRLEHKESSGSLASGRFQFHKGTIRTTPKFGRSSRLLPFQFHKGTIRTKFPKSMRVSLRHFNSIKVRLERAKELAYIKKHTFQFHKGTIRTEYPQKLYAAVFYFNSIKVRLERFILLIIPLPFVLFQFHKGTIRTITSKDQAKMINNFNSIKVRLELGATLYNIPLEWYFNSIKVRLEPVRW